MPRMSPAAVALAVLALRCPALQVASDTDTAKICEGEMMAFEAPHALIGACNVFCVPAGECLQKAQMGELGTTLGITEAGNCKRLGYTEDTEFGNTSTRMAEYLTHIAGSCKGLSLAKKFKKPAAAVPESGTPGAPVCPYEQVAFEGLSMAYPGICSRFCVPEGACQERAMKGAFAYLGITGQGDCESKGYTNVAQMTNMTRNTEGYLKALAGPCQGMTLTKLQKPPSVRLTPEGPLCKNEKTAFVGIAPHNPHMCSVYCVPGGECMGKVQMGAMSPFGVMGEGNCKKRGFTEFLPHATNMSKYVLNGPCTGIERFNFLKPGLAGK